MSEEHRVKELVEQFRVFVGDLSEMVTGLPEPESQHRELLWYGLVLGWTRPYSSLEQARVQQSKWLSGFYYLPLRYCSVLPNLEDLPTLDEYAEFTSDLLSCGIILQKYENDIRGKLKHWPNSWLKTHDRPLGDFSRWLKEVLSTHGIFLDYPLNHLMNRNNLLSEDDPIHPAIVLPAGEIPGSGNIIITGHPGTAKSTLALQIATACVRLKSNYPRMSSAYISLEQTPEGVKEKARAFGWEQYLHRIRQIHNISESASPGELAEALGSILTQPRKHTEVACPFHHPDLLEKDCAYCQGEHSKEPLPCVLIPSLSGRPTSYTPDSATNLFWERYHQLERLLIAAQELRRSKPRIPPLRLVCIDSLNMFGAETLSREELYRVFDLFRRTGVVGIFVVESSHGVPFDSTMADVVIQLACEEDGGYLERYLGIQKSRYVHQVYGKQVFKTASVATSREEGTELPEDPGKTGRDHGAEEWTGLEKGKFENRPTKGITVFPSLHYIVGQSDFPSKKPETQKQSKSGVGEGLFGFKAFDKILSKSLKPHSVITIEGPLGTHKTNLAASFAGKGLSEGECVLIIRFRDHPVATPTPGYDSFAWEDREFSWEGYEFLDNKKAPTGKLNRPRKWEIFTWRRKEGLANVDLVKIHFKSGNPLPEEFIQVIRDIFRNYEQPNDGRGRKQYRIKRVILDDVSSIALSYPLLYKSKTTGDLFLPTFVHLMRNYEVDLVMAGTTSELDEANESVRRALSLSDAIVSCRFCDVFGDRYTTVTGEGLMTGLPGQSPSPSEFVPPIVRFDKRDGVPERCLRVDSEFLDGLVGFEKEDIHRPGIYFHIFKENDRVHGEYNKEIELLLRSAFASPSKSKTLQIGSQENPISDVTVEEFDSSGSEAVHYSLDVLQNKPMDKTVLYTVDELGWERDSDKESKRFFPLGNEDFSDIHTSKKAVFQRKDYIVPIHNSDYVRPYYANVLLLAYRKDLDRAHLDRVRNLLSEGLDNRPSSWSKVRAAAQYIFKNCRNTPYLQRPFGYDLSAPETLSCMLMDALAAGKPLRRTDRQLAPWDDEKKWGENLLREVLKSRINRSQVDQLMALHRLMFSSKYEGDLVIDDQIEKYYRIENDERIEKYRPLPPDAGVYLCWYSQLRELIARCPELAEKLDVCALPGGGFKGDWFVGVAAGSVSLSLGKRVIGMLTSQEEEYKRFVRGVGLPTREFFDRESFFAWAGASASGVTLQKIYAIHKKAFSRASIPDYPSFRSLLFAFSIQLTPQYGTAIMEKERIKTIVSRLGDQIKLLTKKKETGTEATPDPTP